MAGKTDPSDLICVGVITGVHGVRGVLTIRPFTEHAEDLTAYGPVQSRDGRQNFTLSIIGAKKGVMLVRIKGIDDRNAAEALKGLELYVPRAVLPEPEDESWYQADLIGLEARDMAGEVLGRVKAVQNYGAGDLLEISLEPAQQTVLLPFTREIVPVVDINNGFVTVNPPEEIEDDN